VTPLDVLLVPMGTPGDVQPFVDMGRAMMGRGHRATIVAHANFRSWVERAGLEFLELGTEAEYKRVLDDKNLWNLTKAHRVFAKRLVIPTIPRLYRLIEERYVPGKTVVAAQTFALGARVARDKLPGMKLATVHRQPTTIRSVHGAVKAPFLFLPGWLPKPLKRAQYRVLDMLMDHSFGEAVNALRAEVGLGAVERIVEGWIHSPDLVLGFWAEWFAPRQRDWPGNVKLMGFNVQESGEVAPTEELKKFLDSGEAPIMFTIGSGMSHGQAFYHACVEVCRRMNRRGVIVTRNREQLPSALPGSVLHAAYAPFNWLLPKCAAVVHHAGIGTVAQALAAAVPQLCVPGLVFDTFDTAARLEKLGVSASVEMKKFSAERAAGALDALLTRPGIAERCREVAARVKSGNAIEEAADALEALGASASLAGAESSV
jgi:rhamnosyltransferase subunit B